MPLAPPTKRDRANTLRLMREVIRDLAGLRIQTATYETLAALQLKAVRADEMDKIDRSER